MLFLLKLILPPALILQSVLSKTVPKSDISIPLLLVCPILARVVEKPLIGGMVVFNSKSLVVFQYTSTVPDNLSPNKVKSVPISRVMVVSHFKFGLASVVGVANW